MNRIHSFTSVIIRFSSLTLILALTLSLFSGCSGVMVTPVAPNPQELQTDVPQEILTEPSAVSDNTAEEAASGPSVPSDEGSANISYPITEEPVSLSFISTLMPNIADYLSDYNDNPYFLYLEEQTGVHIDWRLFSGSVKEEQYKLIFAAEDYSDLMFEMLSVYTGGAAAAIENEVILDLEPLLAANAPDYYALISDPANEDIRRYITLDDGSIAAVWGFSNINAPLSGTTIRKDWLDDLGEDIPVTYDDWTRILNRFKNEKGAESPLFLLSTVGNGIGGIDEFSDGFDVQAEWYVIDGEVRYGLAQDKYRGYLSLLHSWYEDGLISSDFTSYVDSSEANSLVSSGQVGLLRAGANDYKNLTAAATEEGFQLAGIPKPVEQAGDTLHFGDTRLVNKAVSITTACQTPELALQWLNYIYTEDGIVTSNYGVEGQAFEYDANGDPQYTDLIKNNPDGLTEQQARWLYCGTPLPLYSLEERNFGSYSEEGLTAITETWLSGVDSAHVYYGDLTAEESEEYSAIYSDIQTYIDENVVSFVTGNRSLDEYPEFQATLEKMGLSKALALKQAAYDRYANR